MQTQRLSLDQFMAKADDSNQVEELQKLSGGVLGACHCPCGDSEVNPVRTWFCHAVQAVGTFISGGGYDTDEPYHD